jgi:hypothetical protein
MRKTLLGVLGVAAATVLVCATASAHHSAAMFDHNKTLSVAGLIKEFQYTQPHCWLIVLAPGENGAPDQEWRFETGAPTMMMRMGIHKNSFPVGEKVTVKFHPLLDGRAEGEFVSATDPDGKMVGYVNNYGPPPPPADATSAPPAH